MSASIRLVDPAGRELLHRAMPREPRPGETVDAGGTAGRYIVADRPARFRARTVGGVDGWVIELTAERIADAGERAA